MTLRVSMSAAFKQGQPLVNFQGGLNLEALFRRKDKVVVVVGSTGTGKSRLAIDLATRSYPAGVVNSDKMQVFKGLDVVTNKVSPEESNSYIEALVNDNDDREFRLRYEFCSLWVDVSLAVLHSFVSKRVNRMINKDLVEEVKKIFDADESDYSRGIRRVIGVPELDQYLRYELVNYTNARTRAKLLDSAISKIKDNTCILACRLILRLLSQWKWNMHRVDATEVFLRSGEEADETLEKLVLRSACPKKLVCELIIRTSVWRACISRLAQSTGWVPWIRRSQFVAEILFLLFKLFLSFK